METPPDGAARNPAEQIEQVFDILCSGWYLGVMSDGLDVADVVGDRFGDTAEVDAVFASAAGFVNAQHGRLVDAAVWLLHNEGVWQGDGLWNLEAYVRWRTGVGPGVARKVADAARRADEFPVCVAALRRGELSLDQLSPIVGHAPGWADGQIAELAPRCTVAQISKICREYTWVSHGVDDVGDDAKVIAVDDSADCVARTTEPAVRADEAWFGWDDGGRFRLNVNVGADTGTLLEAALIEARDARFQSGNTTVDTVDTVIEIAHRSLDAVASASRRNRYRVNIHFDRNGHATDSRGRPIPGHAARRIGCDALVSPIVFDNGVPVQVGRSQHVVPDRTRRIVEHRDGGCAVPGCHTNRFVEVHHIVHWADGGATDTSNLVCLCPRHHRLHHQGRLGIDGDADQTDGVVFTDANGTRLAPVAARPEPVGIPPPIDGTFQHPLGERLEFRWVGFTEPTPKPSEG